MKNIAVIEGGYSHEKVISLKSAETVFQNIDRTKYRPTKVRIDEEGWFAYDGDKKIEINLNDFSFNNILFDFAFIVIHGTPGEDGKLQAYFDMLDIPYSTCSQLAATLTFNKFICNQYLKNFGINVADAVLIRQQETIDTAAIIKKVGLPCFVKPADGGSSFGVTKVKEENGLETAIQLALKHGTQAIIESFMDGREVTNGIYKNAQGIVSLPVTEIISDNDFFDFDAKYKGQSHEITPADLPEELTRKIKATTRKIYEIIDLKGICRADYIIQNNEPYLIEINTVPGQSAQSIIPQMAAHERISLKQLFNEVIEIAIMK
ncbi:MAG: D-alanine--D-alanine ligase [Vicingus serpentipes]|nr:D-alanine--D-alanine ligase [Vicingus serpentipes]